MSSKIFPIFTYNNYYFHSNCLSFDEIKNIVNDYDENDINNEAFDWGINCDMDRIEVKNPDIYEFLSHNVREFADNFGIKIKFKIFEPWLNTYKKGQYQEIHDHADHHFAATIFMNTGNDFGKIYFQNRVILNNTKMNKLLDASDLWYPDVRQGSILIFPGYMFHGVSPHKNDEVRKTLSFNIDVIFDEQ
tara:strand:- start:57 stop:626 length:570 start_codon:yes stop_codon:yes gene_type:complete